MKYFFLLSVIFLFSCSADQENTDFKFEISNAIPLKMTFERLVEFEGDIDKKRKLNAFLKSLAIDSNPGFIGWVVKKEQQSTLKNFIKEHKPELLFDKKNAFIWSNQQQNAILFQKNNRETLNFTKAVINYNIEAHSITINLTTDGVAALRNYTLKHINKTLLIQINNQLISSATSLGDFKGGTLIINNIDSEILKAIQK